MTGEIFIVVPANVCRCFIAQADRDYFANPVRVELSHSCVATRQLYVTDPRRGHTYPVDPKFLKSKFRLTNRQLAAVVD